MGWHRRRDGEFGFVKFGPVEFGTYMELEAGAIGGPRTMLSTADVEFGPVEFRHLNKN